MQSGFGRVKNFNIDFNNGNYYNNYSKCLYIIYFVLYSVFVVVFMYNLFKIIFNF